MPDKASAGSDAETFIAALCEYAKIDNRSKIRKKLKSARLKLRKIYPTIKCEGISFYEYAKSTNSAGVVKFIETKIKPADR